MHKESSSATTEEIVTDEVVAKEMAEKNTIETASDEFEQYLQLNKADGLDSHPADSYIDYSDSYDDYGPRWSSPEFNL